MLVETVVLVVCLAVVEVVRLAVVEVEVAAAVVAVVAVVLDVTPFWSPDAGAGAGRTKMYRTRIPTNSARITRVDGRTRTLFIWMARLSAPVSSPTAIRRVEPLFPRR